MADEGQISFQQVRESYESLVDVYNQVNEMYLNDLIPRDENFEKLTNEISAEMDRIAALKESDIPTDEDKIEVLKRIGELDDVLGQMISENGGSNEQIQVLIQARDEIGEMGDLSMKSMEDLKELNDRIDHVTSLLDALAAST